MQPTQSDAASAHAKSELPGPLPGKQPDQSMLPPMLGEALSTEHVSRYEPLRAAPRGRRAIHSHKRDLCT